MSNAIYHRDFGVPGQISWIMMIRRDGTVGYCTEAWTDSRKRVCLEFKEARSAFCIPKLFGSQQEAEALFRGWQRSFPANATGWDVEITEFEA